MKTCGYCGRENEDSAIACRECGQAEFADPAKEKARLAKAQPVVESEPETPDPDVASGEEACICPFCLFPNLPHCQWCKNCGSPFNASVLDPYQSAVASGLMWRGILRGRPKLVVLCMTWLLLLPLFLSNCAGILIILKFEQDLLLLFCGCLIGFVYLLIQAVFLYRATRNFLTIPKPKLDD